MADARPTPNQVIAYNMARYRRASGLTQEELGERLAEVDGGVEWSKASVSAAERSWDGKRVRRFDADLIVALAVALGVPVMSLFVSSNGDPEGFRISSEVLPDVVHDLYRAAGHPEPIILTPPDDGEQVSGEIYADGGHVEVTVHGAYAPGPARRLAAFIAHTADEAERPTLTPEAVKTLADVIYGTDPPRITHDMAHGIAEIVLRAGYSREGS